MAILSWGECKIQHSESTNGKPGSSWEDWAVPKKDTTKITPTIGTKKEAFDEGDNLVDVMYGKTKYTLENNKVVIVTYRDGESTVKFVLNYNIYTVDVRIDGVVYTLDKYEYVRIDG